MKEGILLFGKLENQKLLPVETIVQKSGTESKIDVLIFGLFQAQIECRKVRMHDCNLRGHFPVACVSKQVE
jgi:hypothetical protein